MDPKLIKVFAIIVGSGVVGSLLALIPLFFKQNRSDTGYGTTAGIGFLVGACLGGMFGIFAVLLETI